MFEVIPEQEQLLNNSDFDSNPHKTSDASLKSNPDSGLFSASSTISRKTMSSKTVTLSLDPLGLDISVLDQTNTKEEESHHE